MWIVITGGPQAPPNRVARSPPPLLPPLPRAGRGNQSWLTGPLSVWSYDTCQVKKVNLLRQGAQEGGAVARVAHVYTRHIRKY